MSNKEGKSKFSLHGYITICNKFMQKVPHGRSESWFECLFASLFMKLSVNDRSDNVDDLFLRSMDWINDALTLNFHTTMSYTLVRRFRKTMRLVEVKVSLTMRVVYGRQVCLEIPQEINLMSESESQSHWF